MTITIFLNLIGELTALFFNNYCVGLKLDSAIGQLAVIDLFHDGDQIKYSFVLMLMNITNLAAIGKIQKNT